MTPDDPEEVGRAREPEVQTSGRARIADSIAGARDEP